MLRGSQGQILLIFMTGYKCRVTAWILLINIILQYPAILLTLDIAKYFESVRYIEIKFLSSIRKSNL